MNDPVELLRPDLLAGRVVLVAGPGPAPDGLGAVIERIEDPAALDEDGATGAVAGVVARSGRIDAAVIDLASVFGEGGSAGLAAAMDTAWTLTRAVATGAMLDAGRGMIVLIAPTAESAPGAEAAAAAIENLARSLSVEWARFGVTVTAVCPRAGVERAALLTLVAWLCSEAGAYVSGTRLEPGG